MDIPVFILTVFLLLSRVSAFCSDAESAFILVALYKNSVPRRSTLIQTKQLFI